MRPALIPLLALIACTSVAADAAGNVQYLSCRADNESEAVTFGIDEGARKECDRCGRTAVVRVGGVRLGDDRVERQQLHYEHNILLLNHIGHCSKVGVPSTPPCPG